MSKIREKEVEIRDIINKKVTECKEGDWSRFLIKHFKLSKVDWARLCSALDLIGDTELAKQSYFFNIAKKNKNHGEIYLRLYGFLNAIYLQCDAVKLLAKLFKIKGSSAHNKKINELEILNARTVLAAHTVNVNNMSFMVNRNSLKSQYISARASDSGIYAWDIKLLTEDYDEVILKYMNEIVKKLKKKIKQ